MIVSVRWAPGIHSAPVAREPVVATSDRRSVPITRMLTAFPAVPVVDLAGRSSSPEKTFGMRLTCPDSWDCT
jgi:hypothetical protein